MYMKFQTFWLGSVQKSCDPLRGGGGVTKKITKRSQRITITRGGGKNGKTE